MNTTTNARVSAVAEGGAPAVRSGTLTDPLSSDQYWADLRQRVIIACGPDVAGMAAKLGIYEGTLKRFLSGADRPTARLLALMVARAGVDASWLVVGKRHEGGPGLIPDGG